MSRGPTDGYVGNDADSMRMRRISKERQKEHDQFEARKRVLEEEDAADVNLGIIISL